MRTTELYVLAAEMPESDDATLESLHKWLGSDSFTKQKAIRLITGFGEDRGYAEWEFERLLEAGFIITVPDDMVREIRRIHRRSGK